MRLLDSARRQGRRAGPRRARDRRARSSPSPTRTRPGRRTRCAGSSRNLADPDVAYVCGQLRLEAADGSNSEGVYWRYELWLREAESRLGSVTGGNGSIYAVRRRDYVEVDPRFGHDLSLPYLMVQRGRRAVYEPDAHAFEKPTPSNEAEYRRKVRMFEHCWVIVLRGWMLRGLPPGLPRVDPLAPRAALRERPAPPRAARLDRRAARRRRAVYAVALARPARAARGRRGAACRSPRYYVLVTWATVRALWNYLRRGVPATWDAAEGTR